MLLKGTLGKDIEDLNGVKIINIERMQVNMINPIINAREFIQNNGVMASAYAKMTEEEKEAFVVEMSKAQEQWSQGSSSGKEDLKFSHRGKPKT